MFIKKILRELCSLVPRPVTMYISKIIVDFYDTSLGGRENKDFAFSEFFVFAFFVVSF